MSAFTFIVPEGSDGWTIEIFKAANSFGYAPYVGFIDERSRHLVVERGPTFRLPRFKDRGEEVAWVTNQLNTA